MQNINNSNEKDENLNSSEAGSAHKNEHMSCTWQTHLAKLILEPEKLKSIIGRKKGYDPYENANILSAGWRDIEKTKFEYYWSLVLDEAVYCITNDPDLHELSIGYQGYFISIIPEWHWANIIHWWSYLVTNSHHYRDGMGEEGIARHNFAFEFLGKLKGIDIEKE